MQARNPVGEPAYGSPELGRRYHLNVVPAC